MKTPGEKICEVEEYLPGKGAYVDEDGGVYAKVLGRESFNNVEKTVNILPPPGKRLPGINVVGSIVYGRIFQVLNKLALVQLFPYKTARFRLIPPGMIGAIYIADVKKEFVEDMHDEFEVGDWVRAKIKKIVKKFYPQLTTVGKELGVIKAYCPYDRTPLVRRGAELYCPKCKRKFKRKIAFDYGDPKLPR